MWTSLSKKLYVFMSIILVIGFIVGIVFVVLLDEATKELDNQRQKLQQLQGQMSDTTNNTKELPQAFNSLTKPLKRIQGLIKRVFFFSNLCIFSLGLVVCNRIFVIFGFRIANYSRFCLSQMEIICERYTTIILQIASTVQLERYCEIPEIRNRHSRNSGFFRINL